MDENTKRVVRLVRVIDQEDGWFILANTSLFEEEVSKAIMNEEYDEDNLDYEEKLNRFAEENGLFFERVYTEDLNF